jgi:hypothetical protein
MKIEVSRYLKSDGYPSRYWAVLIDGDLLAVTLYRKGAEAVAKALSGPRSPTSKAGSTSVDSNDRDDGR